MTAQQGTAQAQQPAQTPTPQHPIDGVALVAALHREVAGLRASAVAQRALAEAARAAQLHGLVADAEKLVAVYDEAAVRLLGVVEAAEHGRTGRGVAAVSSSQRAVATAPQPRVDLVAELLVGARRPNIADAVVRHSLKVARAQTATAQQRYAAVAALVRDVDLATLVLESDRGFVTAELRGLYDAAATKLPGLKDCVDTVEEIRRLLRGTASEESVRRDDALKQCVWHLQHLLDIRAAAGKTPNFVTTQYRDLVATVRGTLQSLSYPGGKAQQLAELTIAELERLSSDFDVAAALS